VKTRTFSTLSGKRVKQDRTTIDSSTTATTALFPKRRTLSGKVVGEPVKAERVWRLPSVRRVDKPDRSYAQTRGGRKDFARTHRGVAVCAARKCTRPLAGGRGAVFCEEHTRRGNRMPRAVRRYAYGRRWTTKKGDRKPARPSGVALASPTSLRGQAQRSPAFGPVADA
jgi:hypothetical protein